VNTLTVSELGDQLNRSFDRGQPASVSQTLPGGVRVEFQVPTNRNGTTPASDEEAAWARRYRAFSWEAEDPNQDELRCDLYLRGVGESDWKILAKDLTSSPWIWDSSTVPDGWYELRVEVSDRAANPPGEELATSRSTDSFLVDNTSPRVTNLRVRSNTLHGIAEDDMSPIKRLEMAMDGKEWKQVFPEDGIPDMPRESFAVPLQDLESGNHVVLVRAFDLAGNPGTGRCSFTTP
jgi:hypothetical protein